MRLKALLATLTAMALTSTSALAGQTGINCQIPPIVSPPLPKSVLTAVWRLSLLWLPLLRSFGNVVAVRRNIRSNIHCGPGRFHCRERSFILRSADTIMATTPRNFAVCV